MGQIVSSKATKDGKVVFEVVMDYEEALQLKGYINNVHMFSQDVPSRNSNVSLRGKHEATKYLLIPKDLRKDLKFNTKVKCQRIDTPTKQIFIYLIDKLEI